MFDISFVSRPTNVDVEGWSGLWGRVVLGEFTESFVAPLAFWRREDYEMQWLAGAQRLIDGSLESAFVQEAGRVWWTAWRVGGVVFVQQRLLVSQAMKAAWTAQPQTIPYDLVGRRETISDDGSPISEWAVTIDDFRVFVARRSRDRAG